MGRQTHRQIAGQPYLSSTGDRLGDERDAAFARCDADDVTNADAKAGSGQAPATYANVHDQLTSAADGRRQAEPENDIVETTFEKLQCGRRRGARPMCDLLEVPPQLPVGHSVMESELSLLFEAAMVVTLSPACSAPVSARRVRTALGTLAREPRQGRAKPTNHTKPRSAIRHARGLSACIGNAGRPCAMPRHGCAARDGSTQRRAAVGGVHDRAFRPSSRISGVVGTGASDGPPASFSRRSRSGAPVTMWCRAAQSRGAVGLGRRSRAASPRAHPPSRSPRPSAPSTDAV